jgi:hypothetical protein
MKQPILRSSYLQDAMDPRQLPRLVRELKAAILADGVQFNAIAFRGMSGALVAPLLALTMKKGVIVCRKESEQSHADAVEGHLEGGPYIIVDDFVSSGRTVQAIIAAIDGWWQDDCKAKVKEEWPPGYTPGVFETPDFRNKTDDEKLPKFVCEKVFCYQRYIGGAWPHGGVREVSQYHDPDGDYRFIPVAGTKPY